MSSAPILGSLLQSNHYPGCRSSPPVLLKSLRIFWGDLLATAAERMVSLDC